MNTEQTPWRRQKTRATSSVAKRVSQRRTAPAGSRRFQERPAEQPASAPPAPVTAAPRTRAVRSAEFRHRDSTGREDDEKTLREGRHGASNSANTRRASRSSKSTSAAAQKEGCPPAHWGLIFVTLLLALASIPMIYSASQGNAIDNHGNTNFFLPRQIFFVGIGLVGMLITSRVPVRWIRGMAIGLYLLTFAALVLAKFSPLGVTMGGVDRWVKLGPFQLQPSELAKFALIGVLADFWSRTADITRDKKWPWLVAFLIAGVPMVLVFIQPHFSAALLLFALPIVLAFQAGVPKRQVGYLMLVVSLCVGITVFLSARGKMPLLKPYQQVRISHLFTGDPDGRYQTEQGLRAMARGGITGVGPGASLFKQGHLPAPHTDFILAIIGEEFGLIGMLGLLLCYGAMVLFCLQIGYYASTPFELLLCVGVGSLLALQVICNLCVVLDLGPVTGVPLPLISYGGSGLIITLMGIGWVLSVSRNMARAGSKKATA